MHFSFEVFSVYMKKGRKERSFFFWVVRCEYFRSLGNKHRVWRRGNRVSEEDQGSLGGAREWHLVSTVG